jgi:hypothetical protein
MKKCYITILLLLTCYVLGAQTRFISVHGGPKIAINFVVPQYELWFTDKLEFTLKASP